MYLKDREDNDFERQYTPKKGPAKATRAFVKQNFPLNYSMFSQERLYNTGKFASIIALPTSGDNVLEGPAFEDVLALNNKILNITLDNGRLGFNDLCARTNNGCFSNVLLEIVGSNGTNGTTITYPQHQHGSSSVFLGTALGGVVMGHNSTVISAKALKLFYYLDEQGITDEISDQWLTEFKMLLDIELDSKNIYVRITLRSHDVFPSFL